ncbi:tyrosine-type recombinase/integrase [Nocardia sp. SYP-A9097]|nr:tyrosine-type recombinase/integrase [Nocardia sp. SYP-A9097]
MSLFKRNRDGMWVGQIELERGPDGKRRKSQPVYSADRAEAVKKLEKLKEEVEKGVEQKDRRLTVKVYIETWIEDVTKTRLRPHVWRSYRSAIRTRIVPSIDGRRLEALSPDDVRNMHKWILAASNGRGGTYTTRSVEEAHNVLSAALTDAVSDGKTHRNVCELVSKPQVLSGSHGVLSAAQAREVLLAAMRDNDAMVTRWAAGLMLGGRQGELLGLQWDRVDLEKGTLDLAWQLEWLPMHKGAKADDPKRFDVRPGFEHTPLWRGAALTRPKTTLSQRIIPIPAPLAAILTEHRKHAPANPWNLVWVTVPTEKSRRKISTPVSDNADRDGWAAALARAGAPKVKVHAMRDTTVTLLMEAGVDARIIQAILGHSNVVTTRGYQHVDLAAARKSLGNLDALLAPT